MNSPTSSIDQKAPETDNSSTPVSIESQLPAEDAFPKASFTEPITTKEGHTFPQTIAHRGYRALYPENTMAAFKAAVAAGAHALETDIHISSDDVIVISHDANLKRCFGQDQKIKDCSWAYLSALRTIKPPHEPMPRLLDLLAYLADPTTNQAIWVLLDIKPDNDPEKTMRLIASTIASVPPTTNGTTPPWTSRILLGLWTTSFLPAAHAHLPNFPITYIGFSLPYARNFLSIPNASFNLLQKSLVGPYGARFMRDARALGRRIFVWTVNEEVWMAWGIRKGVGGVITDEVEKFLDVCKRWEDNDGAGNGNIKTKMTARDFISVLCFQLAATVLGIVFWIWFRDGKADRRFRKRVLIGQPQSQPQLQAKVKS
ncbi:MAG: hypothetical protein M1834_005602 [Cirrosporium novae-zelandiae]|nr:MAG: hypothetical protein M1834_005602 [Cirrosporium novae-zelandiae]